MAVGPKPKRADLIKGICNITRIKPEHGSQFSNKDLRELLLWVQQARKIIADISSSTSEDEGANATA